MNVAPYLQRVFVLPTGPIRVRIECDDTEPVRPIVRVAAESDGWITIRVACGLQQLANPARATVEDTVTIIVEATLPYLPSKPEHQMETFRAALAAWIVEHRSVSAGRTNAKADG